MSADEKGVNPFYDKGDFGAGAVYKNTGSSFQEKYNGLKGAFQAELAANEVCWKKCNISLDSDEMSQNERSCMNTCQGKFSELNLLIESEWAHYVRGIKL